MNVLLVSQCTKRALNETRRILDQFAERKGHRSWQTPITLEGLKTLHRLLRKTARKNTAVACFRLHRNASELLWIVGNRRQFNERGSTPTNTTRRDLLRTQDENDWRTGEDIRLLASLAGLMHDLGKANRAFQNKLQQAERNLADVYRHEWVSLRLFQVLVGEARDDSQWLERLSCLDESDIEVLMQQLVSDPTEVREQRSPLKNLPPLAQAIGWLVLSHHRLPTKPDGGCDRQLLDNLPNNIRSDWCGMRSRPKEKKRQPQYDRALKHCWDFPKGTPFDSTHWRTHAHRLARHCLERSSLFERNWLDDPHALHLARLGLMLADHHYSSQKSCTRYGDKGFPLHANTREGQLNQRLDEHLIGVEVNASRLVQQLPRLGHQLARTGHNAVIRQRSKGCFAWQNRALELAESIRDRTQRQGFFGINMASTGTGKTLANAKILYGLSDPTIGVRFNVALGLRTLTLQTGDNYRDKLGLGEDDLAVLVGGGAIRELHELQREEGNERLAREGRESLEDLLAPGQYAHYEGSLEDGPLRHWLDNRPDAHKLLAAPVLVSTIDHLVPATESVRGGRQIAPMLRLLETDLVLDEPDDFDLDDLPALARLVHWSGLLGGRVLLSSATLPPALVEGLFDAYRSGRAIYQQNRGEPGRPVTPCCAWFDEFGAEAHDCSDVTIFADRHRAFVDRRLKKLATQPQRRRARILPLDLEHEPGMERAELHHEWAHRLRNQAEQLHDNHAESDPVSGKRLSCGLIRMAHIDDIVPVAQALLALGASKGRRIHLCVYHSRQVLLLRSRLEALLDRLLKRDDDDHTALFKRREVRHWLDTADEQDHLFIVLASPVAEVGRDHDYDWAIVEPSSMRSFIQLAGRVRRHRPGTVKEPNIVLMQTNLKHLKSGPNQPAFVHPGFETCPAQGREGRTLLRSHHLDELLRDDQLERLDASARIREPETLHPRDNLSDLEHARLRARMGFAPHPDLPRETPIDHWWKTRAHLSGILQKEQPFRREDRPHRSYYFAPDEDGELRFRRREHQQPDTEQTDLVETLAIEYGPGIALAYAPDLLKAIETQAEQLGLDPEACGRRLATIDLPVSPQGEQEYRWSFHPGLGFIQS